MRVTLGVSAGVVVLILLLLFFGARQQPVETIGGTPEVKVEKPAPPPPPNADNSKIILELFNPSDQSLTHQLTTTSINQQIEQTLTVSFVLTKCLIISQDDYRDTFRALVLYAELAKLAPDAAGAEARVREIAESAKASYALIYSRTSCTDPQLPTLAKDLSQWTTQVFTQQ